MEYEIKQEILSTGNVAMTPVIEVSELDFEIRKEYSASGKPLAIPVYSVNGGGGTGTDTGWIPLTLASDWEAYQPSSFGIPSYRVLNGVVYIQGRVSRVGSTTATDIATLPPEVRPTTSLKTTSGVTGTTTTTAIYVKASSGIIYTSSLAVVFLDLSQIIYPLSTAPSILTTAPNNDITNFSLTGDTLSIDMLSGTHKEVDLAKYVDSVELTTALSGKANVGVSYTKLEEDNLLSNKADLDGTGTVPQAQLPSYVDDVMEYANLSLFPVTGVDGKIYVAIDTNKTYRWTGSVYVALDEGIVLGETSATGYRGDRGKIAYDHTFLNNNPHGVTKSQVGLGNANNTSDTDKPISTATQTALNGKANVNRGFVSTTLPYTALITDTYIASTNANGTLTLPSASIVGSGKMYSIKKNNTGAGNVTITPTGGQTIDGNATLTLSGSSKPATRIVSDGTNWIIF